MNSSPLEPRHEALGARLAERPEAPGVLAPLTFGDVPGEYEAAVTDCAVFDETPRGRVTVRGAEAAPFLHRLLANDVRGLEPGRGNRNLLLSPKGKILFDFDLVHLDAAFELSTPPGRDAGLAQALDLYHFSEDLTLEVTTAGHAPLDLVGPGTAPLLARLFGREPALAERETVRHERGFALTRQLVAGHPGYRLDAGAGALELWDQLLDAGARPAGLVVRDILRAESGAALFGVDIDDTVYPQEARLEEAFDLSKGCYVGQEVVAKIDTYGGLNKRLMALRVDGDEPVQRGTRLLLEEDGKTRDLGVTTTWAYSFALDSSVVLGYVKRRHQEPGTVFRLGDTGVNATIVQLPLR